MVRRRWLEYGTGITARRPGLPWLALNALALGALSCRGDYGLQMKVGSWIITELTGSITMASAACEQGPWVFEADPGNNFNYVVVGSDGSKLTYILNFHGVAGSPHPDGYRHSGSGVGKDDKLSGQSSRPEVAAQDSLTGTFDDDSMHAEWHLEQHEQSGGCTLDITGSGTFSAVPP